MPFGSAYHASAELAASLRSFRPTIDVQSFGGDGGEMVLAVHVVACRASLPLTLSPTPWWSSQIFGATLFLQQQQPSRFKASHAASQAALSAHSPPSQLLVSVVVFVAPLWHCLPSVSEPQVPRAAAAGGLGGGGTGGGESNRGSHESPSHTQHTSHHLRSLVACTPLH